MVRAIWDRIREVLFGGGIGCSLAMLGLLFGGYSLVEHKCNSYQDSDHYRFDCEVAAR